MAQESASSQCFQASREGVMRNIARSALMALGFLTATILSGWGSGTSAPPPPTISISFNGGNSQTISQGQSILLTVNVSNDPSGRGVTWEPSGSGALSKQAGASSIGLTPACRAMYATSW